MFFLLLFMSSLQQNWKRGQNRFCLEARGVGGKKKGAGGRGRGEKWLKQCMHLWISEKKFKLSSFKCTYPHTTAYTHIHIYMHTWALTPSKPAWLCFLSPIPQQEHYYAGPAQDQFESLVCQERSNPQRQTGDSKKSCSEPGRQKGTSSIVWTSQRAGTGTAEYTKHVEVYK
jgi:hypothetical protein